MQNRKCIPILSACVIFLLAVFTFAGILPQGVAIVAIFVILGGSNLYLATLLWKKHKRLESGFLAAASLIVVLVILSYVFGIG